MIESNGGSSSYLTRTAGLIASTGAMTILGAFRRTADRNADSVVLELQSAGGGTVHTVATSGNGDRLRLYANWASQRAESTFDFTDAQIVMIALRGNGTTLSLSVSTNLGGSWTTVSVTQTVFTPAVMFVLNNDRGEPFHGGVCYLSEFDRYMSDAELSAQAASASIVVATGLRSFKKGIEATIGDALTGTNGTAFTSSGTLTVNTDAPSFPSPDPDPDPPPTGDGLIVLSPGGIIEYHGDSTIRGHNSIDGNRVATPAPERFSLALGSLYVVRNKGFGLASTTSLLAGTVDQVAWATYVPASDADVFIINHGINDNYGGTTTVNQYGLNLEAIVDIVRDANKQIIFETSNPVNSAPQLNYVNKMREVAAALNVPLIDQHAYLMSVLNGAPVFDICPDGTHPSQATYLLKGDYAAGVFQTFLTEGPGPDPEDDVVVTVGGELDLLPAFLTTTATAELGAVEVAGQFRVGYGLAVTINVEIRKAGVLVASGAASVDQNAQTFTYSTAVVESGDYVATITLVSTLGGDVRNEPFTATLPAEEPEDPDPTDLLRVVPQQIIAIEGDTSTFSIKVVDIEGRGREGLTVATNEPSLLNLLSSATDADGVVQFKVLSPGVALITIFNAGGNPATLIVQVVIGASPEPDPEPGVSSLKLVNPISGMNILDGPYRITVVDQDDNPLPEDRDNALVITVSKPGYVRSGKRAYGGVITLAPEAVGTSTIQLSYEDPTYGKITLQFSVSVLP